MKKQEESNTNLTVSPPNFITAVFGIRGNAPYVQNKFSEKAKSVMRETQEAGSTSRKGKKREGKDFRAIFEQSKHRMNGEKCYGIPAGGFRSALISACRVVGFAMTRAKLSIFIVADGFDVDDGTPLVRITKGRPEYVEHVVRIQQTTDVRARAMWQPGWEARVQVRFDADQFTAQDVANLMVRVGMQVGIGEGRPDSRTSCGMGWGTFDLID